MPSGNRLAYSMTLTARTAIASPVRSISLFLTYSCPSGKKDKKVLVVITDGNDNASNESLAQLLLKAPRTEVLIYSIGLLNEEEGREARSAKRALKALAEASEGLDYYPKSLGDVEEITPNVAHEIRNQYILGYLPLNPALDGTFRQIKVTVNGFGRPSVRTRNGYYATPDRQTRTSTDCSRCPSLATRTGNWALIRSIRANTAAGPAFSYACGATNGICVRIVCRDTNWAPVSVINPHSTARYSSQVSASRDSNPRC